MWHIFIILFIYFYFEVNIVIFNVGIMAQLCKCGIAAIQWHLKDNWKDNLVCYAKCKKVTWQSKIKSKWI